MPLARLKHENDELRVPYSTQHVQGSPEVEPGEELSEGDDQARTVELDWFLETRSRQDTGPLERRRERVTCRLARDKKSWKIRKDRDEQRDNRDQTKSIGVAIFAVFTVKRADVQLPPPPNVIIRDHDPTDRA